jgi:hypothetical protein
MIECPSTKKIPGAKEAVSSVEEEDTFEIRLVETVGPMGPQGPPGPPGEGGCGQNLLVHGRRRTTIIELDGDGNLGIVGRTQIIIVPVT